MCGDAFSALVCAFFLWQCACVRGSLARSLSRVWVGQRSDEALFFLNRDRLYFYYTWCSVASRGNLAVSRSCLLLRRINIILLLVFYSTIRGVYFSGNNIQNPTYLSLWPRLAWLWFLWCCAVLIQFVSVVQKQEAALSITEQEEPPHWFFWVRPGLAYYYAIHGVVGTRGSKWQVVRCSGGRKHKTLDTAGTDFFHGIIQ